MDYDYAVSVGPTGHMIYVNRDTIAVYAYLVDTNEVIVGDVWLCNVEPTPSEYPWRTGQRPPFANPADFAAEWPGKRDFLTDPKPLSAIWTCADPVQVELYFEGLLIARLSEGEKPGSSILATRDGPLAKTLLAIQQA